MKKYKIGEYVLYHLFGKRVKCKVVGYDSDKDECIVKLNENKYVAAKFEYLSPLKKEYELEVGDKFIPRWNGRVKCEVLFVAFDEHLNVKKYLIKESEDGFVRTAKTIEVKEIIYD